ncbi:MULTISPECIES: MDR/zinc-dependent alcohol dehydrogenase-like family protein [Sphingobium]|uniref:MDR/zinc-dependent alcohol dehydrogenase-like family protein n=1 Tax=Sphingobium TaxID=165695 RepID=UPI001BE7FBAF|nr:MULTISPECIES: zinc-binding dehydrogenase [Sphingobium]MBT2245056.1 zinc-binding dehydrogenase [Sphingobium sp. BHU LFT2]WBQ19414.1 zinc-binding dehydrogenase [Sphingobium yanoikuyae]
MSKTVAIERPTTAETMRAAVVIAPGTIRLQTVARPEPGTEQVRIRLEGCGVCASNLTPWAGPEWQQYPLAAGALGHEGWGIVEALGEGVTAFTPGDRVAALSYAAYAEYDLADAASVVKLPDALEGIAFPGEALGCAFNIFHRSDIRSGQTVAIVGIGFLGAILTRLATNAGARVIAISRRMSSLALARDHGAAALIAMDNHRAIIDRVHDLTGGNFCERVIEAVGKQWPLDLAAELTAERGRLIIAGYHQDGPRQVNMWLWNWRGIDVVNAHERDPLIYVQGMREAVTAIAQGMLDPTRLVTHRYRLDQLDQALDATRDKPEGFVKAAILL